MSSVYDRQLRGETFTSLPAGSTTDTGQVTLQYLVPRSVHTMVVTAVGSPTAGSVQLQLSHDGVNWFNAGSATTTSANGITATTVTAAALWARVHVATTVSGGTGTITATVTGV